MLNVRIATPPPRVPDALRTNVVLHLVAQTWRQSYDFPARSANFSPKTPMLKWYFIGGGAGMVWMRSHIFDQLKRLNSKRKITSGTAHVPNAKCSMSKTSTNPRQNSRTSHGTSPCPTHCLKTTGRLHRLSFYNVVYGKPSEKPRSAGRLRILYVWSSDHEPVRHQNASDQAWKTKTSSWTISGG